MVSILDIGASGDESLCPMDVHTMGTIGSAHIKKHFVNAMPVDITTQGNDGTETDGESEEEVA